MVRTRHVTRSTRSIDRARRSSVAVLLACIAAACPSSKDESGASKPAPAATNASAPPRVTAQTGAASVFTGRVRKLPPWGDDLRARIDPAVDGWPTEVAAEWIEQHLKRALEQALTVPDAPEACLAPLLADDFEGAGELVPQARTEPASDGNLSVWSARSIDGALASRDHLGERLAAWRALVSGSSEMRVELGVEHALASAADRLETTVAMRVFATTLRGTLQENVTWRADWRWSAKKKLDPRLLSMRLEKFEDVRAEKPTFRDATRAVFGSLPFFDEEIVRGASEYHLRQDRLSGQPFLGMHGIAIGDVDGDGLEDVYLPQPGGQPNRLLMHQPDGTVKDVAHEAGVDFLENCGPALLLDLDNDGDLDLAVAAGSSIIVSWNDGTGHFKETTILRGADEAEITSMSAADFDGDGDLDLYACRYVKGGVAGGAPVPYYAAQNGATNFYWRNEGHHKFKEAAAEAGLAENNTRFSLALICEDLDEDGIIDLFVVNDFGLSSFYKNDGKGHFTDVAEARGLLNGGAGMGATCGDFDLDGHIDMYVTNMHLPAGMRIAENPQFMSAHPELRAAYVRHARGNTLLRNKGDGTFEDVTERAGVARGRWAWGSVCLDWNNGGYESFFVPNGFASNAKGYDLGAFFWRDVIARSPPAPLSSSQAPIPEDYLNAWDAIRHFSLFESWPWNGHERKYAYWNLGDWRFVDVSAAIGVDLLDDGRAAAPIDWDDDGRIDLLLRNRTGPRLRYMHNEQPRAGHFLSLELAGTKCNRDAIGAQVRIEAGGRKLRRTVYAAQGFMCAPSRRLHFGLGAAERAERVEVRWPDGSRETFENVAADRRYRIVQGTGKPELRAPRSQPMSESTGEPLASDARPEERVVLFDRMPMSAIELPLFDGEKRTIASFAGAPLLVTLWSSADPTSREALQALARQSKSLASRGVRCVTLAREDAGAVQNAREFLRTIGLETLSGAADARFTLPLEVVLVEVLGPYDKLAMPIQLLLDGSGQLAVLYSGAADPARIVTDAETLRRMDPKGRATDALLGGRWAAGFPARDLGSVAEVFQSLGLNDLERFYRDEAHARSAR
jgi:hypothetical protein